MDDDRHSAMAGRFGKGPPLSEPGLYWELSICGNVCHHQVPASMHVVQSIFDGL